MVKEQEKRFGKPVGVRLPKIVEEAMKKRVKDKRKQFPRYDVQDMIRTAIIKHLKEKGYLDKGKDYL
jgi:hypothetical protein